MDNHVFLLLSSFLLFKTVSMSRACSCRPNLKEEACTSDYVIIAKVLEERQIVSDDGWVFHYSLNVTKVLKTSASYEGAVKVMQIKLRGNECGGQLKPGHAYIFAEKKTKTSCVVVYIRKRTRNVIVISYSICLRTLS